MDMLEIGQRIRAARGDRSQLDIAKLSGIKQSTISAWELGRGNISLVDTVPLSKALGVPVAKLFPIAGDTPAVGLPPAVQVHADRLFSLLVQMYEATPSADPNVFEVIYASAAKSFEWLQTARAQAGGGLPILRLVSGASPAGHRHRLFENLAAGVAGQVEPLDRVCHVAELADRKNISLLVVQGESMLPTLKPGDIAVVRHVEPPFELPAMGKGGKKRPLAGLRSVIGDGQLGVYTMNDEGEAVKRFHFRGHDEDWQMVLGADNADWAKDNKYPKPVARTDRLVVYGQVLGVAR